MKLSPVNMYPDTYHEHNTVSQRSDEQMHDIRAEQMRRIKTKDNFEKWLQKAHDKDIREKNALNKHREEQAYSAWLVREEQKHRKNRER